MGAVVNTDPPQDRARVMRYPRVRVTQEQEVNTCTETEEVIRAKPPVGYGVRCVTRKRRKITTVKTITTHTTTMTTIESESDSD